MHQLTDLEAQWLSGRVLDSRPRGRGFEPHPCHCVVSLSKNINPSLVLVQPRKTRPFITERWYVKNEIKQKLTDFKARKTGIETNLTLRFSTERVTDGYNFASQKCRLNCPLLMMSPAFFVTKDFFLLTWKQYEPRSDCSIWSSLIQVHTVCNISFQNTSNEKQMT